MPINLIPVSQRLGGIALDAGRDDMHAAAFADPGQIGVIAHKIIDCAAITAGGNKDDTQEDDSQKDDGYSSGT